MMLFIILLTIVFLIGDEIAYVVDRAAALIREQDQQRAQRYDDYKRDNQNRPVQLAFGFGVLLHAQADSLLALKRICNEFV